MRPRNREINIFSMSTLDVIFGALGAFLILMITAFARASQSDASPATQEDVDEARLEQQLAVAMIEWSGSADVDLWLESNGTLYGPKPQLFPGRAHEDRQRDATSGGTESISISKATGTYTVYFRLHDLKNAQDPVLVSGWFLGNSSAATFNTLFLGRVPLGAADVGKLTEIVRLELDQSGAVLNTQTTYWDREGRRP